MYLDAISASAPLRIRPLTGALIPAHCTAAGKVLLANLPAGGVAALYRDESALDTRTERSIRTLDELRTQLVQIRIRGFAVNYGENNEGVGSVARVLRSKSDAAVAAISVAVPVERLTSECLGEIAGALTDGLREVAVSV